MARRFFRRFMPNPDKIRDQKILRVFGTRLHSPNLWHLNRRSVSRAFFLGLFWSLIPLPTQMVPAAFCAIGWRANLGISIALVWITNPLTMAPIYYVSYRIGCLVLGQPVRKIEFTPSGLLDALRHVGVPLYVGAIVFGLVLGAVGWLGVSWLWRWNAIRRWKQRRHRILPLVVKPKRRDGQTDSPVSELPPKTDDAPAARSQTGS